MFHTPPLLEKGASGHSTHKCPGSRGGAEGWSINHACLGDLRVSHCVPFIRADQELLWGSSGLQNRGEREGFTDLRGNREEGGGVDADLRIKNVAGRSVVD